MTSKLTNVEKTINKLIAIGSAAGVYSAIINIYPFSKTLQFGNIKYKPFFFSSKRDTFIYIYISYDYENIIMI